MDLIQPSIASFFVACTMLLALRPFAAVVGLIDKPGGRKTHHGEVPVVGGIAMYSGLVVAVVGNPGIGQAGLGVVVVAGFMVVLGALDDRFDLPPNVRLFAHLSAAVALVYSTGYLVPGLGDLLGGGELNLGILTLPFTVLAVVALINAFNMLDGLDGLAGSAGLVALGGLMIIGSMAGSVATMAIAGCMLGAVGAFLVFNLPTRLNRPIRTFMGDAGSTLLGFVLADLSLTLVQPATIALQPVTVLWLMPIPIFELFSSTTRRVWRGMSPAQADTGHFHHRLVAAGLSVRAICALYFLFSAACSAVGVWSHLHGVAESLLFAGFCSVFLLWVALVRLAPRFILVLPDWFRRMDASVGH
jgi:UDP-GlcNAc:undecaprenyl-phosphate GlcNAc-1-phosphate transferase